MRPQATSDGSLGSPSKRWDWEETPVFLGLRFVYATGVVDLRRRVLVIDDQAGFRTFLQRILEVDGYQVDVAEDGDAGLAFLTKTTQPCVVLVDLLMPRVNGIAFITRLRDRFGSSRFPVIVISALFGAEDVEPPDLPGVRGVIGKPFEPRVVRAAVRLAWEALEQPMGQTGS